MSNQASTSQTPAPILSPELAPVPDPGRSAITAGWILDEATHVREMLALAALPEREHAAAQAVAADLVRRVRARARDQGVIEAFMRQYDLGSEEGVLLMCVAEALLRIPDQATADALIRDKLGDANWKRHLGQSDSVLVNASTWGLLLTGKLVDLADDTKRDAHGAFQRLVGRAGEPVIRLAVRQAMKIMGRDTTTVTGARGHRIGVGDVILTRLNDATIEVRDRADVTQRLPEAPVRNGQRWQVLKVDDTPENPRIAARRLGDGAVAVLEGDYLRQHVQLGHAVTVHSAQGVTAERCRAVIGDTTTRNLAYVAMTRGRDTNEVYLYERTITEADHHRDHPASDETGVHVAQRGGAVQAARMMRQIVGRDEPARTAHRTAADTPAELLPELVANLVAEHHSAVTRRHVGYQKSQRAQRDRTLDRSLGLDRDRGRERDRGYDLSL